VDDLGAVTVVHHKRNKNVLLNSFKILNSTASIFKMSIQSETYLSTYYQLQNARLNEHGK